MAERTFVPGAEPVADKLAVMPIELLGRKYFTEAECAARLGCSTLSLARLRKKGDIGYQRLPGKRGAYYSGEHVAQCLTALSVPARPRKDSPEGDSGPISETTSARDSPNARRTEGLLLSDIQRASEILRSAKTPPAR